MVRDAIIFVIATFLMGSIAIYIHHCGKTAGDVFGYSLLTICFIGIFTCVKAVFTFIDAVEDQK